MLLVIRRRMLLFGGGIDRLSLLLHAKNRAIHIPVTACIDNEPVYSAVVI
jgi:hypothetical protein